MIIASGFISSEELFTHTFAVSRYCIISLLYVFFNVTVKSLAESQEAKRIL